MLSSWRHLQKAERGQVPGTACGIAATAAKALILGMQGCMPEAGREGGREGGRMQVKCFTVRGLVPRNSKKQVVPLNEHATYKNTPPEEVYPLVFSCNTWLTYRVKRERALLCVFCGKVFFPPKP